MSRPHRNRLLILGLLFGLFWVMAIRPHAIHDVALSTEHHRQASAPVNRVVQMEFVEPPHEPKVFLGLQTRLVVVSGSTDFQQFALATDARLVCHFD
jgi:hypothetical protein